MPISIFPSLIEADLMNLGSVIKDLSPFCDGFHIDVMDNHFVPNLTWGPAFVNAIARQSPHPLHVHCMVDDPVSLISSLKLRPVDTFILHVEAPCDIQEAIAFVKRAGWLVGLAVSPQTPLEQLKTWLSLINHILIMSVEPGFSGQIFLPQCLDKLSELAGWRQQELFLGEIGMDGGISKTLLPSLEEMGCDIVAMGSAIFKNADPISALEDINLASF